MIPVNQTIFTAPGGNCFQACIASILELKLEDVPHVFKDSNIGDNWKQEEWSQVCWFADENGYRAFWIDPEEKDLMEKLVNSDLYYIAMGPSRRGNWGHCVVMHKGEYIHDPMNDGFLNGDPWLYVGFEELCFNLNE